MILSVSKRTDIPAFYSDWFFNRIKEGYVLVRNPFNFNQISKVDISPDVVDCIVFWTKDAAPMINRLELLKEYKYYFQFTITPYDESIEKNARPKKDILLTFKRLSEKIGKDKVIWRYDPIFISDRYTIDYHIRLFKRMCEILSDYTEKCVISFIDEYKKNSSMKKYIRIPNDEEMDEFARRFSEIAKQFGIKLQTCAEKIDLDKYGIEHGACIDKNMIESVIGYKIKDSNKKKERSFCGCYQSIDIGQYDSCVHDCVYCYATRSVDLAVNNFKSHNPESPILIGGYNLSDIKERKVEILKKKESSEQISFNLI